MFNSLMLPWLLRLICSQGSFRLRIRDDAAWGTTECNRTANPIFILTGDSVTMPASTRGGTHGPRQVT